MRILVTGATGYIGRAVALALASDGHDVVPMVRDVTTARATSLERSGLRPVHGDLVDTERLAELVHGVDAVAHTAQAASDPAAGDRALIDVLVDAAAAGATQHLVYPTGCSVYGHGDHPVLSEDTPVDPENPRAQLEDELRATGLAHTVLRPAMVHGGDAHSSIVGRWFRAAVDDAPVHYGTPSKLWSWVHVDDVATAYSAVLREPAAHNGQVYLLADASPTAPLDVVTAAARTAGCATPVAFHPISEETPTYRGFDRDEVIDASKARTRLGWAPSQPSVLDALPASFAAWRRTA